MEVKKVRRFQSADTLLDEYSKCQKIVDEQNSRLEEVTRMYVLMTQQTTLLTSIDEWKRKAKDNLVHKLSHITNLDLNELN